MIRRTLIIILSLGAFFWGGFKVDLLGAEDGPARSVVRVVGLDKQDNPQRQGLGVVLGQDGRILTSASLLIPGGAGVVLTGQGAKYLIQEVAYLNEFQDLAVIKVNAEQLPKVDMGLVKRLHSGEAVRLGLYQKNRVILQEAQVASVYPFSSRLILIKLNPPLSEAEPGAPLLDSRGDLVGLVHSFAGKKGNGGGFMVILARGRDFLPQETWLNPRKKSLNQEKNF